jgi:hypothetical protein
VGDAPEFAVTDPEDAVLQPFLGKPAMDLGTLKHESGDANPPRVLKRLQEKYGGQLAPYIHFPGGKSKGGYRVDFVRKQPRRPDGRSASV